MLEFCSVVSTWVCLVLRVRVCWWWWIPGARAIIKPRLLWKSLKVAEHAVSVVITRKGLVSWVQWPLRGNFVNEEAGACSVENNPSVWWFPQTFTPAKLTAKTLSLSFLPPRVRWTSLRAPTDSWCFGFLWSLWPSRTQFLFIAGFVQWSAI